MQHTVPRFLLNEFGFGKKKNKSIYTFDKHDDRVFPQSVKDATTRNSFYNVKDDSQKSSLEPLLGEIESTASIGIKKLISTENISVLTDDEKKSISTFVVVQQSRTFHSLQNNSELVDELAKKINNFNGHINVKKSDFSLNLTEKKNMFLSSILSSDSSSSLISNKSWILYKTSLNDPFYISDNPVTLHNDKKAHGIYGNIGLGVRGIQIHLPISSTLVLAFHCPSVRKNILKTRDQQMLIEKIAPQKLLNIPNPTIITDYAKAYETGQALIIRSEFVRFLNSLQVIFSEQYLFSHKNEFELVQTMIKDNAKYRNGFRSVIS